MGNPRPKLRGKIHVYMGDQDTFILEEATMLMEEFLEGTTEPHCGGTVQWDTRQPHCFTGTPPGQSNLEFLLPQMAAHLRRTAPRAADVSSWVY